MADIQLSIKDLHKSFGELEILRGIDLDVRKGEVVVLLGPSGCGKSTLLRCINGLETIQHGSIALDGEEISGKSSAEMSKYRQKIGMVFQSYDLFPHKTILDNITMAPQKVQKRSKADAEKEARELLRRVGLGDKENAYPRMLSGGQKQRVAIVRALEMHPEMMLFDEVTASLDPEMVRGVLETIKKLSDEEDMTMLIVTHEMNFAAQIADRVLFLEDGHILEDTPGQQFFKQPQTERAQQFLESMDF